MFKNNFIAYYKATIRLLMMFIMGIIIFTVFRTAHLFSYGNLSELSDFKADIIHAYWTGLRFDATVLAHGLFVIFILNLITLFFRYKPETNGKRLMKLSYCYLLCVYIVFIAILLLDFFYYMFFQTHISKLVFGILNEPMAVLTSVWTDYPIAWVVMLYLVIMLLLAYVTKKIFFKEYGGGSKSMTYRISVVAALIFFYFLALRGSIGKFPISKNIDSYVSANIFLNDLTLNGVFSFKEAFAERIDRESPLNIPSIFSQSSFFAYHDPQDIYKAGHLNNNDYANLNKIQFERTPDSTFLKENPPNVVFFLMESMSNYYLDLHSSEMNLLGSLEKQLKDCLVFRNFLPLGNNTAQSLIGLTTNIPDITFIEAQQALPDKSFSSSVALPFLKAGYHTSFITGEYLEWIGIGNFMPMQHFQTVEGREVILSEIKEAEANTAGVYDEFIFAHALNKLKDSNGQPQFIFILSSSNHTPFDLPASYKPFPVEIQPELAGKIKTSKNIAIRNFTAYQYANDSLGRFMEKLRSSPLGENTIVVATGDHNILQLFQFSYMQLLQKLSVPLIMYIPDKYMPAGEIDTTRFASHKDIFPTVFNLSLSSAAYLSTGNNLVNNSKPRDDYFSIFNNKVAMNADGVVLMEARPLFYQWQKKDPKLIEPTTLLKTPELERLFKKSTSYIFQMNDLNQS